MRKGYLVNLFVMLFVAASQLPDSTSFTVVFSEGNTVTYKIEPIKQILGGQAFVIFARVDSHSENIAHKYGEIVALKLAFQESNESLDKENKTYRHIIEQGTIKGVIVTWTPVVYGLGKCSDINCDLNFTLPDIREQEEYHVLVMQRVGISWQTYHTEKCGGNILPAVMLQFTQNLVKILADMKVLGIAHGDIRPDNILMDSMDNDNGETFLVDFGLSTVEGGESSPNVSGGNLVLMSFAMFEDFMQKRTRTVNEHDDADMTVNTLALPFGNHLPWLDTFEQLGEKNNNVEETLQSMHELRAKFTITQPEYNGIEKVTREIMERLLTAARKPEPIDYAKVLQG